MREVRIVIRDDFDGSSDAETIQFGWLGKDYEIDLSEKHRQELEALLAPYVASARPTGGVGKRGSKVTKSGDPLMWSQMSYTETMDRRAALKRIREWAETELGEKVAVRARVPLKIHRAYNEAHPEDQVPIA